MTDQDEAKLCNNAKNHLGYDEDGELPPDHDVEAGTSVGEGEEGEGGDGENPADGDDTTALSAKDKVPAIYQVVVRALAWRALVGYTGLLDQYLYFRYFLL